LRGEPSEELRQRFEKGVVQTASLLKHFIDERAEVRLVLGDEVGPFGSGIEQLYRCLRRLALVTPIEGGPSESFEIDTNAKTSMMRDAVEHDYAILLTAAEPGSIPASIWRSSHVLYL
jgi:hypothetical protein